MTPTAVDLGFTALCLWREARGEGERGMLAVACVLRNRVHRRDSSYYAEVVRPWAFSSITANGDPQLRSYPKADDPSWLVAQKVAAEVVAGSAEDPTGGATLYYDCSIQFPPSWDRAKVAATVKLGRLSFFREL